MRNSCTTNLTAARKFILELNSCCGDHMLMSVSCTNRQTSIKKYLERNNYRNLKLVTLERNYSKGNDDNRKLFKKKKKKSKLGDTNQK